MPLTLDQILARLTKDLYPGVWQQERLVVPARSDVTVPHILGREPDLCEIGDPPLFDDENGPSVEDLGSVPWSKWFNKADLPVVGIPVAEVRPAGHPLVEVIHKTSAYVVVRNWFEYNQDVGLLLMVRQPRLHSRMDDEVGMHGVWVDFMGDPLEGTAPMDVVFTDLTTYTDALTPTSWDWDWGDGTAHGNTQNPTHTYAAPGNFDVTLTVTLSNGVVVTVSKPGYVTTT